MTINYFPFHIGDFLGGTMGMDATETGAYVMLIVAHYQEGINGLPDDDVYLARIARVSLKVWKSIGPRVLNKFNKVGKFWEHERVIEELRKIAQLSAQNSAKALKQQEAARAAAQPQQCHPIANSQEPKERKKEPPKGVLIPDWLCSEAWEKFKDHRGSKFTANAQQLAIAKLDRWRQQGHDPAEILNNSVMNGWKGLFEPKGNENGRTSRNLTKSEQIDRALDLGVEAILSGYAAEGRITQEPCETELQQLQHLRGDA